MEVTVTRPRDESEFGGAPGPIQPPPHKLTAIEEARLMRKVSTTDPEDSIEAARIREGGRME